MLKKMKALIAVAALSGTVSANVQAATIPVQKGESFGHPTQVHTTSIVNIEKFQTVKPAAEGGAKQGNILWDNLLNYHMSVSQIREWNQLIVDLIHPGSGLLALNTNQAITGGPFNSNAPAEAALGTTPVKAAVVPSAAATAPGPVQEGASSAAFVLSPAPAQMTATPAAPSLASDETAAVPTPTPAAVTAPVPAEAAQAAAAPNPAPAPVETAPAAPAPTPVPASTPASVSAPVQAAPAPAPDPAAQPSNDHAPAANTTATDNTTTKKITVKATAYTASCEGCSGVTATGINIKANPGEKVIAVDPSVIPLGSKVDVEGFGEATAADTGGAIKGNRIDIFMPSEQDAVNFGVKQVTVRILN